MKSPKKKKSEITVPQAVLILDKDAGMLKLVKNYVETLGTREVVTVTEAEEAWEKLTSQPFDIVIMDWKMSRLAAWLCMNVSAVTNAWRSCLSF